MSRPKYFSTQIEIVKSFRHVRELLLKYDADRMMMLEDFEHGQVGVEFVWRKQPIRFVIDTGKILEALEEMPGAGKAKRTMEHAGRVAMRLVLHYLENSFELIEWRVMTPAQPFLPFLVLGRGVTVSDVLLDVTHEAIEFDKVKALTKGG